MIEESVPNVGFCFWNLGSVWNDENMLQNLHVEMKITGEQQMIRGPPIALDLTQVIPQLLSNLLRQAISVRYILHMKKNKETLRVIYYITQHEVFF